MIENKNPGIRDSIPELMGGFGNLLREDPQRPQTNWLRPVHVTTAVRSTYVVPGDWPGKPDAWFADDAPPYKRRQQNNVEYFIDGEATYEAMVEAMETATGPDHFIVIIGWTLHVDFTLSKTGNRCPSSQRPLLKVLKERVAQGVLVRVLLYYNPLDPSVTGRPVVLKSKEALDELEMPHPPKPAVSKIRCLVDDAVRTAGAHHQKIVLVYGSEGLIGFLGGIDFNPDRVIPTKVRVLIGPGIIDAHGPLHDVHARVTGDAADDLMVLATNRWNYAKPYSLAHEIEAGGPTGVRFVDYPTGRDMDDLSVLLRRARAGATSPSWPHHVVQLGQTVGNPELAKVQGNGVWPIVRHGIRNAKKFIYVEDQYLWSVDAAEELGRAAGRLWHVTILLPPDDPLGASARHRALKRMKEVAGAAAGKIRIYVIREAVHQYVHAKMFIFNDEYVIIGSANSNNRGYFYDSEVNAGIADLDWQAESGARGGKWWFVELNLAHKLRIQLWAEHLRLQPDSLVDGVAAEVHWRHPPPHARIEPYTIGPDKRQWHAHEYDASYFVNPITDPRP